MLCTPLPLEWKRYINGLFSLWNVDKKEIREEFIVLTNSHHPTQLKEINKLPGYHSFQR